MASQTKVDLSLLSYDRSNKKNKFYTVAEIKSFLKEYGVSTSGSKPDLVDRLKQVVKGEYVKPARSPRSKSPRSRSPKNRNNLDYFYVNLIYDVASEEEYDKAYDYWHGTFRKAPVSAETEDRIKQITNNGPDKAYLKTFENDLDNIIRKTKGIEKIEHKFIGIDRDHDDPVYDGQVVMYIYLKVYYTPDLFKGYSEDERYEVVSDIFNLEDVPDSGYIFVYLIPYFRDNSEFEEVEDRYLH